MATTQFIGVTLLVDGQANAHATVNEALNAVDAAIAGLFVATVPASPASDIVTLTAGESTSHIIHASSATRAGYLLFQKVAKSWIVRNTGSTHNIFVQTSGQVTPVTVPPGAIYHVYCDGTDILRVT